MPRQLGFAIFSVSSSELGGGILEGPDDMADDGGLPVWTAAEPDSQWFPPDYLELMINRVDDLDQLVK